MVAPKVGTGITKGYMLEWIESGRALWYTAIGIHKIFAKNRGDLRALGPKWPEAKCLDQG